MGIKAIKLKDNDELKSFFIFNDEKYFLLATNHVFKKIKIEELKLTKRYNEPKNILIEVHKKNNSIINTTIFKDNFIFNILYENNEYINSEIDKISTTDLKNKVIKEVYLDEYIFNKQNDSDEI